MFIGYIFLIFIIATVFRLFNRFNNTSYNNYSYRNHYKERNSSIEYENAFFNGTFSMLAKLACADGQINDNAKRKIEQFMNYNLNLSPEAYNHAVSIFNKALSDNRSFESYADEFYNSFSNQLDILQLLIDIFYRVAMSDGHMSLKEDSMIYYAARRFNIPDSVLRLIKNRYGGNSTSSSTRYYAVLGLKDNASNDEIKSTYRKLIKEFHPDTVSQKGAGEQFKEYAKKRFQEIQDAYEQICKERGIK